MLQHCLLAVSGDKILKISVKGSQDGSWGLTQSFKKDCDYHEAIAKWLDAHHKKTIFCLVQFKNTAPNEMLQPAVGEIPSFMKTILGVHVQQGTVLQIVFQMIRLSLQND